jgi:hypothetical protein
VALTRGVVCSGSYFLCVYGILPYLMWVLTCNGSDWNVDELAMLVVQAQEGDLAAYGVIVQRCQGMALATPRRKSPNS